MTTGMVTTHVPPTTDTVASVGEHTWVDPDTWYAQLASYYAIAQAFITDPDDRVLLVKPSYRDLWTWPGGYVDAGEQPHQACARELHEELGLALDVHRLLVVDWAPPAGKRTRALIAFTFDAGVLHDPSAIRLNTAELEDWAFLTRTEALERLPANVAPRLLAAWQARDDGRTRYLPAATH